MTDIDPSELTAADLIALEKSLCEDSLAGFIKRSWPVLEPGRDLVWGWVLDAICDHLVAVSNGEIRRLLINVPPGCMKSLTTRVFWPIWEWIHKPSFRYIGASYAESLAMRDNRRARMVFNSDWFQQIWGHKLQMSNDQTAKGRFENNFRGWMQATSVKGMGTGERADRFIVDDPHNVKQAESDAEREGTLQWFSETVPTRLNDLGKSAIVVIMQRVHQDDVSGHILEHGLGYTHLILPMEFEPERAFVNNINFADKRTEEGELLWPERFSKEDVDELKSQFRAWGGSYAEAGQLQQRPAPREGGLFKADQFEIVDYVPDKPVASVRYWDKAGTQGGGARTAGVLMHRLADGRFCIEDVRKGQYSAANREKMIKNTADMDAEAHEEAPTIWVEQEPGSGGKESADYTIRNLAGHTAKADKLTGKGSKEIRAEPYAAQVEIGNVVLVKGEWNREFIEEHRHFPQGKFADQVDASAGAFSKLVARGQKKPKLTIVRDNERPWTKDVEQRSAR